MKLLSGADDSKMLHIACCDKNHVFKLQEVIRLEAKSNYTLIHSFNHHPLLVAKVLSDYEAILLHWNFVRVHRSHLVNCLHILKIDRQGNIVLKDNTKVAVPRRRKKAMRTILDHISRSPQ